MDFTIQLICLLSCVTLVGAVIFSLFNDSGVSSTRSKHSSLTIASALGFAVLFIALASVSKFKHFKGFGFDAETWSETQDEAKSLVDNLKSLSLITTKQLANLSVRPNVAGGETTPESLYDLKQQTDKLLSDTHEDPSQIAAIDATLIKGIKYAFIRREQLMSFEELSRIGSIELSSQKPNDTLPGLNALVQYNGQDFTADAFKDQFINIVRESPLFSTDFKARMEKLHSHMLQFMASGVVNND